jgi:hypothetical protein
VVTPEGNPEIGKPQETAIISAGEMMRILVGMGMFPRSVNGNVVVTEGRYPEDVPS